jgi:hypothetical protein
MIILTMQTEAAGCPVSSHAANASKGRCVGRGP